MAMTPQHPLSPKFPNPFGGRRATGMPAAGMSNRPAPDNGDPPMAPTGHTAGQYRAGAGPQPSLGDVGPMVRGTAGRPWLDVRDDQADQQPSAK